MTDSLRFLEMPVRDHVSRFEQVIHALRADLGLLTFANPSMDNTRPDPLNDEMRTALRTEAARIEEDSLFSAKRHFAASKRWNARHYWIGVPTTVLAALAGASAFKDKPLLAGVLSAVVAALSALSTFLNPSGTGNRHHAAGTKYQALRNQSRIFRELDLVDPSASYEFLAKRLKDLADQRDTLNESSPQTSQKMFERARRGIEAGEAAYAVDRKREEAAE